MPIKQTADILRTKPQVLFFVGAGISTSAGIPDFRSPETGLYHNLSKLSLPYAEAVFNIDYFKEDPIPFYTLSKELYPGQFTPTKFHCFIKLVEQKGLLKRVYTQNIDTLERIAGVTKERVIEAHGSFDDHRCVDCGAPYDADSFKEKVMCGDVVQCECGGYVKPSIVFFGEGLPSKFFSTWESDSQGLDKKCLAMVAGTSLKVHPFASLPDEIPQFIPRVLVNQELVGTFEEDPRDSDVVWLGHTDEFVVELCKELGWLDELEELMFEKKEEKEEEKDGEQKEEEETTVTVIHTENVQVVDSTVTVTEIKSHGIKVNEDKQDKDIMESFTQLSINSNP
jgi:NAD-dependent histone deacetylase SIR2